MVQTTPHLSIDKKGIADLKGIMDFNSLPVSYLLDLKLMNLKKFIMCFIHVIDPA